MSCCLTSSVTMFRLLLLSSKECDFAEQRYTEQQWLVTEQRPLAEDPPEKIYFPLPDSGSPVLNAYDIVKLYLTNNFTERESNLRTLCAQLWRIKVSSLPPLRHA